MIEHSRSGQHSTGTIPVYFNCIDFIRMLAALTVVIFHYHHFYLSSYSARSDIPAVAEFPYAGVLAWVFVYGDRAVELFWVISGFVFMHVYLQTPTTLGRFAIARFARLYPLHFATLLLVLILQSLSLAYAGHWQIYGSNRFVDFVAHLFMGSQWTVLTPALSFNGPIWSVSLEIGAYGAFFLLLPALRRFGVWPALALALICIYLPYWRALDIPLIRMTVFTCAGYFFFGVVLYFIFKALSARSAFLILACLACAGTGTVCGLKGWTLGTNLAFSSSILLLAAFCDQRLGAKGNSLRSVGNISYSLYLVHAPLQITILLAADLFLGGTRSFAESPLLLPLYVLTSVGLATLAFVYFERPAGRYLRRLQTR